MTRPQSPRHTGCPPIGGLALRTVPWLLMVAATSARLHAQPAAVAFDYRSELKLQRPATVLVRGDVNGDGIPDILAAGPGSVSLLEQGSNSFEWRIRPAAASTRTPVMALAGKLNGDSRDDLVLLCGPRPATLEIYLTGRGNLPVPAAAIELDGDVQQALLADLDGDKHSDILLYGKKTLGITVYSGNGRGEFTPGPVLFPETSVSQAAVARMDGDDLADIVLIDWINDRVEIFPSFGGFVFGDPRILPFDQEPIALALADLNGDRYKDVVAGFGEKPGFTVLTGDGRGNFATFEYSDLEAAPEKIRIGDIDGDARNDLLLTLPTTGSVVVRYQDGAGSFTSQQSYSSGAAATDVVFFQDARRKYLNSAVLSSDDGVIRILHNRSSELPAPEGLALATGSSPGDLEVADLNDDGWADIALTQTSEPVLNFFLNNGRGHLKGQASLQLPVPVTGLIPLHSSPGGKDFLASVPGGKSFAYLSLSTADLSVIPLTVRTDGAVEPIDGRIGTGGSGRRIYALKEERGARGATVYAYDIVDRTRYEETDMPLGVPGRIVAAAPHDFDGDGRKDIALLAVADTGSGYSVTIFRQAEEGFVRERSIPVQFPGVRSEEIMLWVADLDGDLAGDLVLNAKKPDNILAVAMAKGDTAYGKAVTVLQDVRIPARKSFSAIDFDDDGRTDLVFVNEKTRTVQFLPGDDRGGFDGPVNLTSARGVTGFGVADINRDRENELILTIADEGVLSVTSFHHPLFERKKTRNRE